MKTMQLKVSMVGLFACAACLIFQSGCVRPTLVGGGNNGPNPLDGFDGGGNGSGGGGNTSDDDPVDSNGVDDDDAPNFNPLNPFGLEVQFTDVRVDLFGDLVAGDDLIVVGTGLGSGVQYLIPSDPNPVAMDIPGDEDYVISGFAVTGKHVILRNVDGEVFVFNTETTTMIAVNPEEFSVAGGPAGVLPDFRAEGDLVAAVMDREKTTDGFLYKVMSIAGLTPQFVPMNNNPPGTSDPLTAFETQVAIDGLFGLLAAQVDDTIYFYNIAFNNLPPAAFDYSTFGGVSNQKPMWLDNTRLMYLAREQSPEGERIIHIARMNVGTTSPTPVSPATFDDFELNTGQFGYFAAQSNSDRILNRQARSVFGRIIGQTPAVDSDAVNNPAVGDDRDDGVLGFGQTIALSPNGEYRFIAGDGAEDVGDLLQISKDVSWEVFNDPRATDETDTLLRARDVTSSDNVCAFINGDDRVVGFVLLD